MSLPGRLPDFADLPIKPDYPPHSAWGVFGDDDQIGTLNLLTPERVYTLVPALKAVCGKLPLHLHSHCLTGLAPYAACRAVELGVDVNAADSQGRTAGHGAAMWGYTDVIKFLAQNGADLTIKDKRGLTPLDAAMGLAGGLGFDGKTGTAHPKTADAIKALLGQVASAADPAAARLP